MSTYRILWIVCLSCCIVSAASVSLITAELHPDTPNEYEKSPTITAAYPNPVAHGDPGEFVSINFPTPTNASGWALTDGHTIATLPNQTFDGEVAFSVTPDDARKHTDLPVVRLEGHIQLADGGNTLELHSREEVVDVVQYHRAPVSQIRDFETNQWIPVGATNFSPIHGLGGKATVFVLPDEPDLTATVLENATERIYLAGYTFSSKQVSTALETASDRDVEVRILLDGHPVGGMTDRQAGLLDQLEQSSVDIRVKSGPHSRYRFHHPKYAIVDDEVLILTENFKPAGTDGMSSRGWGVLVDNPAIMKGIERLFEADFTWRSAMTWRDYRLGRDFQRSRPAMGSFPTSHYNQTVSLEESTLLVSPDNAATEVESMLLNASTRILIQQVQIDSRDNRLLLAAMQAANDGAKVRIHLSDAWYVKDDNRELVEWLNREAALNEWDLVAKVDDSTGYEKIHTKGIIVDDTVLLGSLNWGRAAKHDNREVVIAMHGTEPATYFESVFYADWGSDVSSGEQLPVELIGVTAVGVAGTLLFVSRFKFLGRQEVLTDWKI